MQSRLILLALLIPCVALAGLIASATSLDPNCPPVSNDEGYLDASATVSCPGSFAQAGGVLLPSSTDPDLLLSASGSKLALIPSVYSMVTFDYDLLVVGTDQSGFLLFRFVYDHTPNIASPNRFQSSGVTFNGNSYGPEQLFYAYLPFEPGVPTHIHGTLSPHAGAIDIFRQRGEVDASLSVRIDVTSQMVGNPLNENPMIIQGASFVALPEPGRGIFVGFGLLLIALFRRGKSRPATPGSPS